MNIFGPTGEFPGGKLNEDDEGAIAIGVCADLEKKVVVVQFGAPVSWLAMPANDARVLGISLLKAANCVEGVVVN